MQSGEDSTTKKNKKETVKRKESRMALCCLAPMSLGVGLTFVLTDVSGMGLILEPDCWG